MKRLFILLIMIFFLSGCASLRVKDKSLEELLEIAESSGYDSTMTGAEVQAELDRCAGRNTAVGDPGSDAELVTEQAVREALDLKESVLTDEASLYSTLSDVTQFLETGDNATLLDGTNWRVFGTNGSGDVTEIVLGAANTFFGSDGANTAPSFQALVDADIPNDISLTNISQITTKPITGLSATNWRLFYSADGAIPVELVLGANGTFLESNGASAAPAFRSLVFGDLPTLDAFKTTVLTSVPTGPNIMEIVQFDNDTADPSDVPGTPNYLGMLARDTTELMPNAIDRTFTGGATAWANVDLNAFNETTDLTITATVADQYCTCPVASAPTTVGKRYRMTYDLANIVSIWTLKSFDGTQTIGTISANVSQGSLDWTATTAGGYRIVATSTTSSGDFDNFTLNELPYIAIVDESGRIFASSIELPCYSHWATGDATYNDTSTPHVLTSEEMKGGLISNCGASEDRVYTCGPAEFGINFVVSTCITAVSRQMDLEPHSGEAFIFNENQMAADEHIQNTADTKGQVMSCWSMETGDGTYEIFCKSDNANWVEATP